MKKVITYGTYDLLHYGHIKLLERAKALGDYLIVGVTSDSFDRVRGKINVQQSLMERIDAVRATGLADQIVVEEYEGQKIDDIIKYNVDIFTVGSDWVGYFDYLKEYCNVVYLDRTQGVSSSSLRAQQTDLKIGLIGDSIPVLSKFERESHYVNGVKISGLQIDNADEISTNLKQLPFITKDINKIIEASDALYIVSHPLKHYDQIKLALENKKHVLCESPIVTSVKQWKELKQMAVDNQCVLMDAIKTAYSIAYNRLLLLAKSGRIGNIVSVDAVCTSLRDIESMIDNDVQNTWNSICAWGPATMLPIFQLLGTNYKKADRVSYYLDNHRDFDTFTRITFEYDNAVASLKVGKGMKSEGQLIISGTKGYIYVPAPWWKTDYFELRFENASDNKRYFYQLEGEGLRNEIMTFVKNIRNSNGKITIKNEVSQEIVNLIESFYKN